MADVKLKLKMKQELPTQPLGYLEVVIKPPETSSCRVWPQFCFLEAYLGDKLVGWQMLPIEKGNTEWKLSLRIPVGSDWPSLSLDLLVNRVDHSPGPNGVELIRVGPHTSLCEAEIGRARVRLVDALLIGDVEEDEEGEDRKRRYCEAVAGCYPRMEGTLVFNKTVELHEWVLPAVLGDVDTGRRAVSRGTVEVCMAMFHA
ncbi:hypothetical protein QOZ80_3AG0241560 [Eleusine coracana subsp. coracana]|nr:hypothetical protein QOZ80_3AG0241560 [Eleusine coracana subsp. coracana]